MQVESEATGKLKIECESRDRHTQLMVNESCASGSSSDRNSVSLSYSEP
jgi:hypothetical protein